MKYLNACVLINLGLLGFMFSGCATITRGTSEQITVQSEPSGASVRLSNGFTGVTPAIFTVPRKGDIIVKASKEGYEDGVLTLKAHVSGKGTAGVLGNALIGGVIGIGVDVATGASLSHVPNPAIVKLVAKPAAVSAVPAEAVKMAASVIPAEPPPLTAPVISPPAAEKKPGPETAGGDTADSVAGKNAVPVSSHPTSL